MADEVKMVEGWTIDGDMASTSGDRATNATVRFVGDQLRVAVTSFDSRIFSVELPLRAMLLSQGLHIVGEADWAVLEACANMPATCGPGRYSMDWTDEVVSAEWDRRAAKGE